METNIGNYIMAKINSFDKATLRALRSEMEAVLEKYGKKVNVDFEVGNMRFSDAEVDIKVKAKVKGAKTQVDKMLEIVVKNEGMKMTNARGDRLVAFKSRSPKYPFVYEAADGKRYKTTRAQAKMMFS